MLIKKKINEKFLKINFLESYFFFCFQNVIDRMLRNANTSFMFGTTSWREQFAGALTVHAGMVRHLSPNFFRQFQNQLLI